MKNFTLQEIAESCNGNLIGEQKNITESPTAIVTDSRKVTQNSVYAAIKGARADGHDFIPNAFEAGAIAVISEKEIKDIPEGKSVIVVKDTQLALQKSAKAYMKKINIPVVGITGSVGKTGTKEMTAAVLSEGLKTGKTAGNHNNEIGLPLTCFEMEPDMECAVLEMGISAPDEMKVLTDIAQPEVAIITNIGVSHMEILGSREGIFKEKSKIYENLSAEGLVILNGDDDILKKVKDTPAGAPLFYGTDTSADIYAADIREKGLEGCEFTIKGLNSGDLKVSLQVPGIHMVSNALAAAAAGQYFGLSPESIKKGLEKAGTVSGRMSITKKNGITIIDDSYNASPVSMRSAVDTLKKENGRKIYVLGDMFELGDNALQMHYDTGRYAAENGADVLFACGQQSKETVKGALDAKIKEARHFIDKKDMLQEIKKEAKEGDIILFKASNSMGFGKLAKELENLYE